ncbi:MAG: argininosuccinate lyase, partial [Saprospiraceae bacterium]|nr:argininosuccinate lyase [Saprospiraceae bacterium]
MKIWEKNIPTDKLVETFTIGNDPEYDMVLAPYDVIGSLAHTKMLLKVGLLDSREHAAIEKSLKSIYQNIIAGNFKIDENVEDVHSQVEFLLIAELGEVGKKIHAGRSRNDQVLVDLRLMLREDIVEIIELKKTLFDLLITLAGKHKDDLLPGYTHLQAAMPSSFGLWFSAYAENMVDDLRVWQAAFEIINQNPLGSGAGYGTSLPLDRTLTTQLLGFKELNYNVVHAQMGRGRSELFMSFGLAATASTLSKLAMDVCLYNSENFAFIKLDPAFTTGSSIMPHKKNPDVFELVRGKCNVIGQLPGVISGAFGFLPSGYHRDFQLLKEQIFPAIAEIKSCLQIVTLALTNITINKNLLSDDKYKLIYSVEVVNSLVNEGVPFREAYRQVAESIASGTFTPDTIVKHTHEGSIGNLCLEQIHEKFAHSYGTFDFTFRDALSNL